MPLIYEDPTVDPALAELSVFLSASIPDPTRWDGDFDPLEITDAVVSMARVFLTAGTRVVTAAHPTIAPLLLYVAAELTPEHSQRVTIYQSRLFEDVLPSATRRFQAEGIGRMIWTPAVPGDEPEPGSWHPSLLEMRRQMFAETTPAAAVFVGGMTGISAEWNLFTETFPGRPKYPIAAPGGEARRFAGEYRGTLHAQLAEGRTYPAVWRAVLDDLRGRAELTDG